MQLELPHVSTHVPSPILGYFASGVIDIDFDDNSDIVKSMDSVLMSVSQLQTRVIDLTVLVKLKMFYLGAVVDKLCDKLKRQAKQTSEQAINIEVNDKLFNILNQCDAKSFVAAADDLDLKAFNQSGQADQKRTFFRQWKFRLMRFFNICSIERKLLFTDLSMTKIVKTFPDVSKTQIFFDYVRTHPEEFPKWLTDSM